MDTAQRDPIEDSAAHFAAQLGMPYFDSRPFLDIKPLVGLLTLVGMEAYGVVPIAIDGANFTIGTSEETDRQQLDSLKGRLEGEKVTYVFMSLLGWNRMRKRCKIAANGVANEKGEFSGVTQALDLVARHFTQPGATIFVDDPAWFLMFGSFVTLGGKVVGIPRLAHGPDVVELADAAGPPTPRRYVIDSALHNPTTASLARGDVLQAV